MNQKINFFTFLIFVYSVIVCTFFKKENSMTPSTSQHKIYTTPIGMKNSETQSNKITASVTPVENQNQ